MRGRRWLAALTLGMMVAAAATDHADARRGGSFGSRGARTYHAPPPTATAPRPSAPIQRSMTPRTPAEQAQPAPSRPAMAPAQARPGFFGGFGRSMLGGLVLGGLVGMLLGHGFGGMAGFAGMLLQIAVLALGAMLLMRLFRRRHQPDYAPAGSGFGTGSSVPEFRREPYDATPAYPAPAYAGPGVDAPAAGAGGRGPADEIGIQDQDLDTFERLLTEIQSAFGREDFAALRERTSPEILSFLSEELAQNATNGVRNEVSEVRLLQGDLAEAWREGDTDYATVAMRYSSLDRMVDRKTGQVIGGSGQPAETTELWTFVRQHGAPWKLSAIQEGAAAS